LRPLKLTMQAFGPYAGREEVDFRRLGERSFFLIHGPTGGGKTTILDAMCYALYGETSGGTRPGKEMRSDYADPETPTEIGFDFSLGGACYRVHRIPEQQRPRKRGEGMTVQRPEATLWKLKQGKGSSLSEADVIETQWSKVTTGIEHLLGFKSDQFRQVIVLPQGRFQELLLAGSKERAAILEILFQTEIYRRIEEALKAAAKDLTDEMQSLSQRRDIILEQAEVDDRPELDRKLKDLKTGLDRAEAGLEHLRVKEKNTQTRLQAGRDLDDRFREREEARQELGLFVEAEQEIREKKEQLKLARKAAGIVALEETMEDRRREAREREAGLDKTRLAMEQAEELKAEAARVLAREKRRETTRRKADKHVIHLEGLAGQMTAVEEARARMEEVRKGLDTVAGDVDTRKTALAKTADAIKALEVTLKKAREEAGTVPALTLKLEHSGRELKQRQKLETSRHALKDERKTLRGLEKDLTQAGVRLEKTRKVHEHLEQVWREGQAGILAATLQTGDPCPVCGSIEHPHPAHLPSDVPDQHRLSEQRARVEAAEKQRDRARDARAAKEREISRLEAEIRSLEEGLGEVARLTLRSAMSAVKKLERDLETAEASDRTAEKATADLGPMQKQENEARKELAARETALKQAEHAFESARAVVREREGKLPKGILTRAELKTALVEARGDHKRLLDAFEAAREQDSETREAHAEARAALDAAQRAMKAAERESVRAEVRFSKRIKASGFSDPEHYENAKLEDSEIEDLAKEIEDHGAGLKAARLRLSRAKQATRGKKHPDLATLQRKAEDAKSVCDERIARTAGIRKEHSHLAGLGTEVRRTERKLGSLEKRYYVAGKIADVANGRNTQGITFQRFVLAALLDDVLGAATERLKVMSRGRFDLHRAGERTDRRLAGGLDLEVYDSYTGTARPVATLSGGETFLAALSLALGLADVVQAYTGGIRMETIFVDEGFGSLDPESLDLAVQALIDLQRGNRLVGIISHVPELKERIDVRLEVSSTRRGSTSRFVGI